MIVEKSNRLHVPHREIAILLDENTILLEDGTEWDYSKTPKGTKIFASKKVIDEIFMEKKLGEVLKYDGTMIKWRMKCPDRFKNRTSWPNDSLEVNVVNSTIFPEPEQAIESYADWRDWIEDNGGNIVGTMSSTSWSLFKSTLPGSTWETPFNGVDGISHPIGGRLLPCKALWSTFQGDLIQWDMYSAYSRKLAGIAFGGIGSSWRECSITTNFERFVEKGFCVYIEAKVRLRREILGPLPIRRAEYHPRPVSNISFPNQGIIRGIWTYEEIREAARAGANIRIERAFIHFATGRKYFHEDWYNIIQKGRDNLHGYSKSLAKQTGNALWGRYAMRIRPAKTVWRENGKRVHAKHTTRTFKRNQCMELADQLCGKIRASLYGLAISASGNLLQGNTDGAWIINKGEWKPPSDDWRIKRRAIQIDIIDDATYRYWTEGKNHPIYVVPGINTDYTEQYFNRSWEGHFA